MEFLDLKAQYKKIKKEIDSAIKKVANSQRFIGGEEVENFEKELARFCGAKYAVGVNSGTDALFLSLKALGIGKGDEVITTPFTFIATAEAVANVGAKPVFADIDENTFNIDPKEIEKKITKKTKAIIPVHLFGQMADMEEIMKIAKRYNLYVIEDSAQAIGAEIYFGKKIKKAGTIGNVGCFSFFPSKNLGGWGDGGAIVTNSKSLAQKIKLLSNHGSSFKEKYRNLILGTNSRLDALQAAILRVKLKYVEKWNLQREKKAIFYSAHLSKIKKVSPPFIKEKRNHVFHQYTIKVPANLRNKLKNFLAKKGIPTMIYYPLPLHLQPAFSYLSYKRGDFKKAEKVSRQVLSLPIYPELSRKDQIKIIKEIKNFFENI